MRRFLLAAIMFGAARVAQAADMPDLPFLRGSFTDGLTSAKVNWQGSYVGGQVELQLGKLEGGVRRQQRSADRASFFLSAERRRVI